MKKRILPLLLALCMLAMLLPMTVAAAFTDASSIQHKDAVEMLTGEGIITGFEDNSFRPNGTLTRAQACAILARYDLEPGVSLVDGWVTYTDVPDNHWALNYIAYCTENGFVTGYGNNRFGPEDSLTGTQWSKMVLTTMGYDAQSEGMVGAQWAVATSSLASAENLYDGISNFNGNKPVTRDNACQILYNAMTDPGDVPPVLPPDNPTPRDGDSTLNALTYDFSNSYQGFGYDASYRFTLDKFQAIFGDTERAKELFNSQGSWGGNCYGMVSSSGLFYRDGNGVNVEDFNSAASLPIDLSIGDRHNAWNITVRDFIEMMHVTQYTDLIQADYMNNQGMEKLNQAIRQIENGELCIITIFPGGSGGHAVLGYGLDTTGTNDQLKIYDPNFPGTSRGITLYGSRGSYTDWYYNMNDMEDWGSWTGGWISFMPYADYYKVWADRAGAKTSSMALLTSNGDINVTTPNGQPVLEIRDGEVTAQSNDAYPMTVIGVPAGKGSSDESGVAAAWVPAGAYNVERADSDSAGSSLQVKITQVEQSVSIVTGADKMTVEVNDSQKLRQASLDASEAGSSFEVTLGSSFDDSDQPATINYKGTVADEGSTLGQGSGGLIHEGVEDLDIHIEYDGGVG